MELLIQNEYEMIVARYVQKVLRGILVVFGFIGYLLLLPLLVDIKRPKFKDLVFENFFFGKNPIFRLRNIIARKTSLSSVLNATSKVLNVSIEKLKSKSKKSEYVYAREIYALAAREIFGRSRHVSKSLRTIGKQINKDHSTITHYYNKFQQIKDRDVLTGKHEADIIMGDVQKVISYLRNEKRKARRNIEKKS